MPIRHLVTRENVNPVEGTVIDPRQIRHGIIVGGRLSGLAGPINPLTHLNLDFPDHRVTHCVLVQAFQLGAPAAVNQNGFELALVPLDAYGHLGRVDVGALRQAWLAEFAVGEKGAAPPSESS